MKSLTHANRGMPWEAQLQRWHNTYAEGGLAWVVKQGPPMRVLGTLAKGIVKARKEGDGPPDYGGTLAGGRSVSFEAKSWSSPSRPWALSQLKDHQAAALEATHRLGGLAFVALQTRRGEWVLPWTTLRDRYRAWQEARVRGEVERGQASLTPEDCDAIGIRMARPGDWLGAMGGASPW